MEVKEGKEKYKKVVPDRYKHFKEAYLLLLERNKDLILQSSSMLFEDSYIMKIQSILVEFRTIYKEKEDLKKLETFSLKKKPKIIPFQVRLRQRSLQRLEDNYRHVQNEYKDTILHIILTHLLCYILETYCEKIPYKHDK